MASTPSPSAIAAERPVRFQSVKVENGPNFIAFARGAAWVTQTPTGKLTKIDVGTGKVLGSIPLGTEPGVIVTDGSFLWVGDYSDPVVRRVDTSTRKVVATIHLAESAHGLSLGAGGLWAATSRGVVRIDTKRDRVVATIATGDAEDVVVTTSGVWAGAGTSLVKIDPRTNRVVTRAAIPGGIHSLAFGVGDLWIGGGEITATLTRASAATGAVIGAIASDASGFPDRIAFSASSVFIGEYKADTVLVIDPATNKIVRKIATEGGPAVVAVNANTLWISHSNGDTVWRVPL